MAGAFSTAYSTAYDAAAGGGGDCDWPISYAACQDCPPFEENPDLQAMAEEMATAYLWNWTGRGFGECTVTVRPCRDDCFQGQSTFWGDGPYPGGGGTYQPALIGGQWFNLGCGLCGDTCSCNSISAIRLPPPISAVVEVVEDGEILPTTAYRVDDWKRLVRTDGGVWPVCQDLAEPTTEPGTWEVTYLRGQPVPIGGQIAAGVLACEFAKAICKDTTCALPQRIQSITRQGVTISTMLDNFEDIDTGHTGIWLIDSWVASVTHRPRPATVRSPDFRRTYPVTRTTWQV